MSDETGSHELSQDERAAYAARERQPYELALVRAREDVRTA